jgi:hypothetical protein
MVVLLLAKSYDGEKAWSSMNHSILFDSHFSVSRVIGIPCIQLLNCFIFTFVCTVCTSKWGRVSETNAT